MREGSAVGNRRNFGKNRIPKLPNCLSDPGIRAARANHEQIRENYGDFRPALDLIGIPKSVNSGRFFGDTSEYIHIWVN